MGFLLSLEAYKHPITGKNLAGPDAEKGPVEINEDAYQDAVGRFHDFMKDSLCSKHVEPDNLLRGMASALAKTDSVWNSGILGPKHRGMVFDVFAFIGTDQELWAQENKGMVSAIK